jgi:hypothetical protein
VASPSSKAQAEGRTLVWVDESGFYLLPAAVRSAQFDAEPEEEGGERPD